MAIDKELVLNFQRIRNVKPEFFSHEGLYDMEIKYGVPVRTAFIGLWTVCDKNGRFPWQPRQLKIKVLPYDTCDFETILKALSEIGSIVKYSVDGRDYGYIPSWKKHQYIAAKEQVVKSSYPAPNGETHTDTVENGSGTVPEPYRSVSNGNGMEKNGKEVNVNENVGAGAQSQSHSSSSILFDNQQSHSHPQSHSNPASKSDISPYDLDVNFGSEPEENESEPPHMRLSELLFSILPTERQAEAPDNWKKLWAADIEGLLKTAPVKSVETVIKDIPNTKWQKFIYRGKNLVAHYDEMKEQYNKTVRAKKAKS